MPFVKFMKLFIIKTKIGTNKNYPYKKSKIVALSKTLLTHLIILRKLFIFYRKGIFLESKIIILRLNRKCIVLFNATHGNSLITSSISNGKLFHSSNNEDHDDDSVEKLQRYIINNKS